MLLFVVYLLGYEQEGNIRICNKVLHSRGDNDSTGGIGGIDGYGARDI